MSKLTLTLALLKPHIVKNPLALSYIRHILKNEFIVIETKRLYLDKKNSEDFYQEHAKKFFFNRLVTFMASGPIDLHILGHHKNAVEIWRSLLGPTSVYRAQFQDPDCLRSMFGLSDTRNVAHGPDSSVAAEKEIQFFFPEFSFTDWHKSKELLYRKGPLVFNEQTFEHVPKIKSKELEK